MEHYFQHINGWATFRELYSEMVLLAPSDRPSRFAEIGSWFGKSAAFMGVEIINSGKNITLECIDPWTDGGPDLRHKTRDWHKDKLYHSFLENVKPLGKIIQPWRMTSLEAVKYFPDAYFDFVMIDGDHSYEAVIADIKAWKPKVKQGGVLAGDDHNWSGVRAAVKELLPEAEVRRVTAKDKGKVRTFEYWLCKL